MVVQHGQWMAPCSVCKRQPALEVHLPKKIRCRLLEAMRSLRRADRWNDATMPSQNLMHSRKRGRLHPVALQTAGDLASSPSRMGIAHRKPDPLDRLIAAARAA